VTALAQRLKERFFRPEDHPYSILEREVDQLLEPGHTLLDAGCGRTAPVLARYRGHGARLVGVDLVDFDPAAMEGLELHKSDLARMPIAPNSVDLIMARSVMEHLTDPEAVYREMHRVLRPGGQVVFITGNLWDYSAIIAKFVPNRFHPWIVAKTEGREEHDVFPVAYRTNTRGAVERLARRTGFEVASFAYRGQYPSYFMFNGVLFLLATGYEKLISRIDSLAFLRGWIHVRLRKI
jgi:SAM-dependent methyltransferase